MAEPGFWDDPEKATAITKEAGNLKQQVEKIDKLDQAYEDIEVFIEMAEEEEDESMLDEIKEQLFQVLRSHFKPEFLNRIDETVMFHPLDEECIRKIAVIHLNSLIARLADAGYKIEFADHLIHRVAQIGYDPVFGARPLRRAIQDVIENPLAQHVLQGELLPDRTYVVDFDEHDELTIRVK